MFLKEAKQNSSLRSFQKDFELGFLRIKKTNNISEKYFGI